MPREGALRVTAFGTVTPELLRQLRDELDLRPAGRLSDPEDAKFGHHQVDVEDPGPSRVTLSLWRNAADSWTFDLAYEGTAPSDELIEAYRGRVHTAVANAGMTVAKEWRR